MGMKKIKYEWLIANGNFQKPISEELVEESNALMKLWDEFCAQKIDHKMYYDKEKFGDFGYKKTDTKETLILSLKEDHFDGRRMSNVEGVMFDHSRTLIKKMHDSIMEIADVFDLNQNFNIPTNLFETKRYWKLKYARYFSGNEKSVISGSHVDDGISVLITESRPGLQFLWKGQWFDASPADGHVLIYPGLSIQYHSKCEVPALCHRVINTPDIFEHGRDSINLYLDFTDTCYDRKAFGSTKAVFPEGSNYNIPFGQFKKYFYGPNI